MYCIRVLLLTILSLRCISVYCQTDTTVKVREYDGWKKGNNTFLPKLSIPYLEKFVLGSYTVKSFENSLGNYERRWYASDTVRDESKRITSITMPYTIRTASNDFNILYISYNADQKIKLITFTTFEDKSNINQMGAFVKSIQANGYVFSLRYERMVERNGDYESRRRSLYYNKVKKIEVAIRVIDYDREYEVTLSQSGGGFWH